MGPHAPGKTIAPDRMQLFAGMDAHQGFVRVQCPSSKWHAWAPCPLCEGQSEGGKVES